MARARGIDVPDGFVDELALYADEGHLTAVVDDVKALQDDLVAFVKHHGVTLPSSNA